MFPTAKPPTGSEISLLVHRETGMPFAVEKPNQQTVVEVLWVGAFVGTTAM